MHLSEMRPPEWETCRKGRDLVKPEVWAPLYKRICEDFGFSPSEDLKSAKKLAVILGDRGISALARTRGKVPSSVLVCGGSESLQDELSSMTIDRYLVAADSATSVVLEAGLRVDMIVTDLDGIVEDQISANANGTTVFIHAHGDNQPALARYAGRFLGPVVGTCQCPPPLGLFNFGGFTDGDRAACICAELGAKEMLLAGFDFENPSEKPGKSQDVKKRKLRWARSILDELSREGVKIVYAGER